MYLVVCVVAYDLDRQSSQADEKLASLTACKKKKTTTKTVPRAAGYDIITSKAGAVWVGGTKSGGESGFESGCGQAITHHVLR